MKKIALFESYYEGYYGNAKYIHALFTKIDNIDVIMPGDGELKRQLENVDNKNNCHIVECPLGLKLYGNDKNTKKYFWNLKFIFNLIYYNLKLFCFLKKKKYSVLQLHNTRSFIYCLLYILLLPLNIKLV